MRIITIIIYFHQLITLTSTLHYHCHHHHHHHCHYYHYHHDQLSSTIIIHIHQSPYDYISPLPSSSTNTIHYYNHDQQFQQFTSTHSIRCLITTHTHHLPLTSTFINVCNNYHSKLRLLLSPLLTPL